jgi:hypothetical protein
MTQPMRLPRVRVTLLSLMAVMAIVTMVLGLWIRSWRVSPYYRQKAEYHARWEKNYRGMAKSSRGHTTEEVELLKHDDLSVADRRRATNRLKIYNRSVRINTELAEFHRRMKVKWERALYHPWLSVEPDPPDSELPYMNNN